MISNGHLLFFLVLALIGNFFHLRMYSLVVGKSVALLLRAPLVF